MVLSHHILDLLLEINEALNSGSATVRYKRQQNLYDSFRNRLTMGVSPERLCEAVEEALTHMLEKDEKIHPLLVNIVRKTLIDAIVDHYESAISFTMSKFSRIARRQSKIGKKLVDKANKLKELSKDL